MPSRTPVVADVPEKFRRQVRWLDEIAECHLAACVRDDRARRVFVAAGRDDLRHAPVADLDPFHFRVRADFHALPPSGFGDRLADCAHAAADKPSRRRLRARPMMWCITTWPARVFARRRCRWSSNSRARRGSRCARTTATGNRRRSSSSGRRGGRNGRRSSGTSTRKRAGPRGRAGHAARDRLASRAGARGRWPRLR